MGTIRNSVTAAILLRIRLYLGQACADSRFVRLWSRGSDCCIRVAIGSRFWALLIRKDSKRNIWKNSLLCQMITELANLIPTVLGMFYELCRKRLDSSLTIRALFALGEQLPASLSWLLFAMLVAPYAYWNNLYSFGAVILFFLLCFAGDIRRSEPRIRMEFIGLWPVLYAILVVFGFVFSSSLTLSVRYLCFHLTGIGLVILCVGTVEKTGALLRIVRFCAAGLFLCSVYALYQRVTGVEVSAVLVDMTVNRDMPGRVYSVFENANSFAMVLVMLIPLVMAMVIYSKNVMERAVMLVILILSSIALVMTYSRAGYLSIAFAAIVFVLILKPKIVPLLIVLGVVALPLLPDSVYHRILTMFNTSDTSISSRIPVYQATFNLIGDYPITGVGLGNQLIKQVIEKGGYYHSATPYIHAHDLYLQIWAELGLFGLVAFLGSVFSVFRNGIRTVVKKQGEPILRGIVAAGISGLCGILLFGIPDYPWSYPRVMTIFWMLFAIAMTAIRLAGKENKEESSN